MVGTLGALGLGAALGAGKYAEDAAVASKNRDRNAEIIRYSPWTGLSPSQVKDPSLFGDLATGAGAGAVMGQSLQGPAAPNPDMGGVNPSNYSLMGPGAAGATDASKYSLLNQGGNSIAVGSSALGKSASPYLLMANPYAQNQPKAPYDLNMFASNQ